MSSFSFKSSGFKISDRIISNPDESLAIQPIGIKTPLEFSKISSKQLFHMHQNPKIVPQEEDGRCGKEANLE